MKLLVVTIFFLMIAVISKAQSTAAMQVAEKIAQRMKDSLSLTEQQKDSIYLLNILLSNKKAQLRKQYTDMDSIERHFQLVESSRDSLYRKVLGEEKYKFYKSKKRNLISSN